MHMARELPGLDLLKGFEEQLGVKLFQRRTRALLLTDEGQRYYKAVRAALDDLRAATASVRKDAGAAVLTVSTTVTFASLWLVPKLAGFQSAQPGVQVRLLAGNRLQDLDRERIDIAVRYCPPAIAGRGATKLFGQRSEKH